MDYVKHRCVSVEICLKADVHLTFLEIKIILNVDAHLLIILIGRYSFDFSWKCCMKQFLKCRDILQGLDVGMGL